MNLQDVLYQIEKTEADVREANALYREALDQRENSQHQIMLDMIEDKSLIRFLKIDTAKMRKATRIRKPRTNDPAYTTKKTY